MSASGPKRAERLLNLLQILYQHRYPISGHKLAEELSISLRSLYRDIAALRAQGADIQGEAGSGYILSGGYLLPPVMYTPEQLDALALGLRWVAIFGDADIAKAASEVTGKVMQGLPPQLQALFENSTLLVGRADPVNKDQHHIALLRSAIRGRLKVRTSYTDRLGNQSERIIWPFALGYLSGEIILAAWCENRKDFRHFNVAKLKDFEIINECYPYSRNRLLCMWRNAGLDTIVTLPE
ncbi:TPA: YafY family transcriptional regulator [Serratia rubidaea]|nr:YafY family transcriptional regulator [Serratia rubidaea]HDJ1451300.1 YafY family transcriptional regulator [Serratia rubidaea]HDJ1464095.1 YafY family transcriptional regulator [Serratia rubidaea]HDJ2774745.1 YafY family transcriptional regulator [Serratia rubidaea]